MNLSDYKIQSISDDKDWSKKLSEFCDASIYQTWNYAKIVQNETDVYHLAIYKSGELLGLAQVRIKRIPILNRGIAYIFNGPVWRKKSQSSSPENLYEIIKVLKDKYCLKENLVLRVKPYIFSDEVNKININEEMLRELEFKKTKKEYSSLLVNLDEDLELLKKNLRPRWRSYLNQSAKNNLIISQGSDEKLYNSFLDLYNQMMIRKDFKEYVNPTNFGRLNNTLDDSFKLRIFIAEKDGQPVAGLVGTAIGRTGIYLLGATNDLGLELKASYLLHWAMIKYMKDKKCLRYDLGGINKNRNPGGYKFKSGISKIEISDIGTYDYSKSLISKTLLYFGQKVSGR